MVEKICGVLLSSGGSRVSGRGRGLRVTEGHEAKNVETAKQAVYDIRLYTKNPTTKNYTEL